MHRNNTRRRRKLESNLSETVRIASIVQKGVDSGRSSYVEMRALARTTNRNLRPKVRAILELLKGDETVKTIKTLPADMSEGYTDVLTPNGNIRHDKLDGLLSIDADIVVCLGIIESRLKNNGDTSEPLKALADLIQERKTFVDALTA